MERIDGIDGDALGCDCYGGCWGDHSAEWPALRFATEAEANEAYRLCHQEPNRTPRPYVEGRYGGYVLVGCDLRFVTAEQRDEHATRLDNLSKQQEKP